MKILIVDDHAVIRAGLKQLCADTRRDSAGSRQRRSRAGPAESRASAADRAGSQPAGCQRSGTAAAVAGDRSGGADPGFLHAWRAGLCRPGPEDRRARAMSARMPRPKNCAPALSRIASGLTYVEGEIAQALAALPGEQRQQLSERDLEILRLLGEGRSFTRNRRRTWASATRPWPIPRPDQIQAGRGAHRRPDKAFGGNGNRPLVSWFRSSPYHGYRPPEANFETKRH